MWNYRPEAWVLPGVICVVLLTLAAMLFKATPIENDLTERALQKLSDQHAWAKVELDGRNLKLSGTAPSEADQKDALVIVDGAFFNRNSGTWGVRVVDGTGVELLPVQSPYDFAAEKSDNTIRLSGSIPKEGIRKELIDKTRSTMPGASVQDDLTLAAGAPIDFDKKANFTIETLREAVEGKASISDAHFDLTARVDRIDIAEVLRAKLNGPLPNGLILRKLDIIAPEPEIVAAPEPVVEPEAEIVVAPEPIVEPEAEIVVAPEPVVEPEAEIVVAPEPVVEPEAEIVVAPEPVVEPEAEIVVAPEPVVEPEAEIVVAPEPVVEPAPVVEARPEPEPEPAKPIIHTFNMERTEAGVKLSGAVLSQSVRDSLIAAAKKLNAGPVTENLTIIESTPQEFAGLGDYGLGLLSQMDSGTVTAIEKKVSIKGITPNPPSFDKVKSDSQKVPEGMTLASVDLTVVEVSPYTFLAVKNGSQIILSGNVPTQSIKDGLVAQAQGLDVADVDDKMTLSAGDPSGFAGSSSYAVRQLSHFTDGSVLISDTNIVVDGSAKSVAAFDAANKALKAPPEGYTIASASIDLPVVSPYVWGASLEQDSIAASGHMPDAESQANVKSALQALMSKGAVNGTVVDETRLAEGYPEELIWSDAAEFGIGLLSHFKSGNVSLSDTVLSLNGEAATPDSYNAAIAAVSGTWPTGLKKGEIVIERPTISPFILSAKRDRNKLSIMGFIPDEASEQKIIDDAKRRFGGDISEVDLIIAKGQPRGFNAASNISFLSLSRLSQGSFEIADTHATLSGIVPFGAPLDEIKARFESGMPPSFTAEATLSQAPPPPPTEPEECSDRIIAATTNNTIYFQSGRATILSESFGFLDAVAEIALSCPTAKFEVSGHTDSDGSAESNQRLSLARAAAVSDYLQRAGVVEDRLLAIGFGEEKPIVDNETPENKALNRRIEFKLIVE